MNLKYATNLDDRQKCEINKLLIKCQHGRPFPILSFMENHFNFFSDMPCFLMEYEQNKLIGFLSIFAPNDCECELYGFVHPAYQKSGVFTSLFDFAMDIIDRYEIDDIMIPISPENKEAALILKTMNFQFIYAEYILKYRSVQAVKKTFHQDTDCLEIKKTDHLYSLFHNDVLVGTCPVEDSDSSYTIYSFEILSKFRRQGFGSYLLGFVLSDLQKENPDKSILLQVNSNNTTAFHMYENFGFEINSQVDYWSYLF